MSGNQIIVEDVADFDLDHIFDCGQCFRWNRENDGSYTGIAFGRVVNMKFIPDRGKKYCGTLVIDNTTEDEFKSIWRQYLDLDRDYGKIKRELTRRDAVIGKAIEHGGGIRLLKQEKWETLLSFIISQNNNIPRIKKCIEGLCENFGEKAGMYRGREYYNIPVPQILAGLTLEELDVCRLGYRAGYIIKTAAQIAADGGRQLALMGEPDISAEDAFEYITGLTGVGPKVANCIMLFSMGKYSSFPIDVWVRKVMHELYGIAENDTKKMTSFAVETFGEYGGFAQQYLFYYMRENGR